MNLIEKYWDYVLPTARAKATEICQRLNRWNEFRDILGELLLFANARLDRYDPRRSAPKTFLNMLLEYARKHYLRQQSRDCRKVNREAVSLECYEDALAIEAESNEDDEKVREFIDALPDGQAKRICNALFIDGMELGDIAGGEGITRQGAQEIARNAMLPLARELGWIAENEDSRMNAQKGTTEQKETKRRLGR